MLCDVCRERDATVTLTHAVKGEVNVLAPVPAVRG